jgi:hypothetical protein
MLKDYLITKGVVSPPTERASLLKAVKDIWYNVDDTVWSLWSDAKLQAWAVEQKLVGVPQAANLKRHELEKLIADNYHKVESTIASSWSHSDAHDWLVKNKFIKSDAEIKQDEVSFSSDSRSWETS